MIRKWEALLSPEGLCELDIKPYIENLTADVISRAALGSSYEEGETIFRLQREQNGNTFKVIQFAFMPWYR
ncbi:hypothetical protein CDL15_Pgr007044 [Punica granatum]|uniref:Uncharacterized protein n=1 Tax=Punica granatum TaxID=22663 RepID=A0A218X7U7_PUNGR|nr:hypothetical protein CDL15_Pgr007044 [Punica granatum]